jgi:hypothetical protein
LTTRQYCQNGHEEKVQRPCNEKRLKTKSKEQEETHNFVGKWCALYRVKDISPQQEQPSNETDAKLQRMSVEAFAPKTVRFLFHIRFHIFLPQRATLATKSVYDLMWGQNRLLAEQLQFVGVLRNQHPTGRQRQYQNTQPVLCIRQ